MEKRLRSERERLGLTQPQLAEIAGAAKRTVVDWEKGVSSPTGVQLARLAVAGIDVQFVLIGKRSLSPLGMEDEDVEQLNALVDDFNALPKDDRDKVIAWVGGLKGAAIGRDAAKYARRKRTATGSTLHEPPAPEYSKGSQAFHGPVGQVASGDLINSGPVKVKQRKGA